MAMRPKFPLAQQEGKCQPQRTPAIEKSHIPGDNPPGFVSLPPCAVFAHPIIEIEPCQPEVLDHRHHAVGRPELGLVHQ